MRPRIPDCRHQQAAVGPVPPRARSTATRHHPVVDEPLGGRQHRRGVFLELTQMCTSIPVDAANLTIDSHTDTGNPGLPHCHHRGTRRTPDRQAHRRRTQEGRTRRCRRTVWRQSTFTGRLPRAELGDRTLLRRRHDQPHPPGRAHRVRPRPSRTLRPHSLGRNRTSAKIYRFIDGAVRSGERVAAEVIQREAIDGGLTRAGQEFDQRCEPALRLRLPHCR